MKHLILAFFIFMSINIFAQSTPTNVNRSSTSLTQTDPYLVALKRLGIPSSPFDSLEGQGSSQNSIKLIYNTTLKRLRVYDPLTLSWSDASGSDLANYIPLAGTEAGNPVTGTVEIFVPYNEVEDEAGTAIRVKNNNGKTAILLENDVEGGALYVADTANQRFVRSAHDALQYIDISEENVFKSKFFDWRYPNAISLASYNYPNFRGLVVPGVNSDLSLPVEAEISPEQVSSILRDEGGSTIFATRLTPLHVQFKSDESLTELSLSATREGLFNVELPSVDGVIGVNRFISSATTFPNDTIVTPDYFSETVKHFTAYYNSNLRINNPVNLPDGQTFTFRVKPQVDVTFFNLDPAAKVADNVIIPASLSAAKMYEIRFINFGGVIFVESFKSWDF